MMMQADELPDVDIWMTHTDLSQTPVFAMPNGYQMRCFREGDISKWVEIQQSADRFFKATGDVFTRTMPGDREYLSQRVMFLVDPNGYDVGSISAWQRSNDRLIDSVSDIIGQVHWVAIQADSLGKGLARPMLTACCQRMIALGHSQACLSTNTRRIPALNLYRKFGFEPVLQNDVQKEAWAEIAPKLKYEEIK